jgi:hypothetical protein
MIVGDVADGGNRRNEKVSGNGNGFDLKFLVFWVSEGLLPVRAAENIIPNEVGFGWFGSESMRKIIGALLCTFLFVLCSPASAQIVQQAAFPVPTGTAAFGWAVAISADGNTAIVGAPYEDDYMGGAYIYNRVNGVWTETAHLVGSGAVPSTGERT